MSRKLRRMSGSDAVRALAAFGFKVVATRGSHVKLQRALQTGGQQILTIPLHRELATGTAHAIFRQAAKFIPEDDLVPWFFTGS